MASDSTKIFVAIEVETGKAVASLANVKQGIERLKIANSKLRKEMKSNPKTFKANSAALADNEVKLKKLSATYREATNAASGLTKASLRFRDKMAGGFTNAMKKVGVAIAGAFAARAVISAISDTINIIKDFEQSSANLAAVLGKSVDEIDSLQQSAKELGATTSFTASQVVELQTEYAKLGFKEDEILAATEATLSLAAATGTELAEAALVAGATMGGFGLKAEETQRVIDVMAKSFSESALDMEKFKESMKTAAPAAAAVNFTLEETTALLGTLSKAGISGSKAGNALKNTFINLAKSGIDLQDAYDRVTSSAHPLTEAVKLVGKIAAPAFLVLAKGQETTDKLTKSLNNAGGAARRMAETQLNTLEGRSKLLTSAWEGFILSLDSGDGVISSISKGVLEFATSVLGALTNTGNLTDEFLSMQKETANLESKLNPLLDRYDTLAENSERSTEEQEELDSIILKIAEDIPSAITEFDKYGKAINISTSAARAFIDQQKRILALQNAEAITEQEEAIVKLNTSLQTQAREYKVIGGVLKKIITIYGSMGQILKTTKDATGEEIQQYQDKKFLIQTEIDDRTAMIAVLKGQKSEAEKLAETELKAVKKSEDETKVVTDLIDLKKIEIRERQAVSAATEEATAIKNEEVQALQDELKALEALSIVKIKQAEAEEEFHFQKLAQLKSKGLAEIEADDTTIESNSELLQRVIDLDVEMFERKKQVAMDGLQSIQDLTNVFTENRLTVLTKETEDQLRIVNEREASLLENEKLTTDERNKIKDDADSARLDIETKTQLESENIHKKAFNRNKAFNLASAIINTASSVIAALSLPPIGLGPVAGIPFAVAAGALGAVQIAAIGAQKFAKGGIIQGNSHDNGGVSIMGGRAEVEGNEIILSKGVTANPTLRAAASQLNVMGGGNKFADGGVLSNNFTTFALPQSESTQDLSILVDAISALDLKISVSEITQAQNNVHVVEQQATI